MKKLGKKRGLHSLASVGVVGIVAIGRGERVQRSITTAVSCSVHQSSLHGGIDVVVSSHARHGSIDMFISVGRNTSERSAHDGTCTHTHNTHTISSNYKVN